MPLFQHPRVRPSFRARFGFVAAGAALGLAAVAAFASLADAAVVRRTFTFAPHEVSVRPSPTGASVSIVGGVALGSPGEPETPFVPAYVEIPAGERVTGITFEASGWTPVPSSAGRVRAAAAQSPGFPLVGSAPDEALYTADAWFPRAAGMRGTEGGLRGRNLASFALAPVRVRPASGAIEVASSITVRIETAPSQDADPLVRRRVVAEWEREFEGMTPRVGRGLEVARPAWTSTARVQSIGDLGLHAGGGGGFAPTVVPSVEGSPVQFLILTNNLMQAEMQRLADWRTRTGVPTVVRTVEFIQANYPYGFDRQDRIRRFIREAYTQWGITHVLLGGDTDVIPARFGRTTFFGGAYIPSDLYYSDLDGNWNADGDSLFGEAYQEPGNEGDGLSLIPDVYVGRAPVTTVFQAKTFVDKVLQYSRTPVGDYENRALFAGEVLFPQDYVPPASISLDGAEDCESAIARLSPEMQPRRMYENYPPYVGLGAVRETRQAVLDTLERGWGVFHHVGHGYRNSMSVGDAAITNPDADAQTNGNRIWLLYSINCTSNAIDFGSLGEAFVLNPNGGAVANVGSTREDFPVTGRAYQDEFYELVFQDKVPTLGEAFARQKFPFVGLAFYDNTHRWTQFTLALLGDPTMQVYWRRPATLAVTAPTNVPLSDTTFTVNVLDAGNPVQNAMVCLHKVNEEYEVVFTDASGNAVMHVRPETAGSAFLTITASSGRPVERTVTFGAASGAVLVQRAAVRTIDDDGAGGTQGGSDGAADAGETIDWLLPLTNSGPATANSVTATLTSTSPYVTIVVPASAYGSVGPGATVNGTPYRIQVAEETPDGTEALFRLDMIAGALHWVDEFRLPIRSPNLVHFANTVVDNGTNGTIGNGNGRLDIGETVDLTVGLRNTTTGTARTVTATLGTSTPGVTVPGSAATFGGNVAPNTTATSTAFRIVNTSAADPRFTLTVNDAYGVRFTQSIDMIIPSGVAGLVGTGAATTITLVWNKSASADLAGYNIYRSLLQAGPFTRLNPVPTDRTAVYVDESLPPLTRYYYQVSAVDSSGNESGRSAVASASTNPPLAAGFPLPTERSMPSSPAIGNIDNSNDSSYEIVVGSNVLWAWHADGTPVRDADGTERTSGDFTTAGSYYAAGATIADLDLDGTWEIIAPTWDDKKLYVYRADGSNFPGFPVTTGSSTWSTVAAGNIDDDPQLEMVFGSNDQKFFAYNHDGTEVRDGDGAPGTIGVFKTVVSVFNYSSPGMANLDLDDKLEIVFVSADGLINAWNADGTNVSGFPVNMFAGASSSPAIGDLDNNGTLEIAVLSSGGKLWVVQTNGASRPGFPIVGLVTNGTSKAASPALADMDGDGKRDIVIGTTDGYVKAYKDNGALIPAWTSVRYSYPALASESSPIVADIDGDGQNEVLIGGEDANLYAFDNDGSLMAGFPIHLNGEIRGTPVVWDVDHDGLTEIILSGWDKNVYMWDYPGQFTPNGPPAWAMWRHDNTRQGRVAAPIVVSAEAVAFDAEDGATSGLTLTFVLPQAGAAAGSYDVYRASGPGGTGATIGALPPDFAQVNAEPLVGTPGAILRYPDASALPGETYRYLLVRRAVSPGETFLAYGPFAAVASGEAPKTAFLAQSFPNPMRISDRASIAYGVPGDGAVAVRTTVRLYDVRGRQVRSLVDQMVPPGRYQATWDGRDDAGVRVPSGVYFYEFAVGSDRLRKKALVLGD